MERIFLGILLEGEVSEYYTEVTSILSKRCSIRNISDYIPPHITLIPPFECKDETFITSAVEDIVSNQESISTYTDMFNFFQDKQTVFIALEKNKQLDLFLETIVARIKSVLPVTTHLDLPIIPHISIARNLNEEEFNTVWGYLKTLKKPSCITTLNNVTVFKYKDTVWTIEKSFYFSV